MDNKRAFDLGNRYGVWLAWLVMAFIFFFICALEKRWVAAAFEAAWAPIAIWRMRTMHRRFRSEQADEYDEPADEIEEV